MRRLDYKQQLVDYFKKNLNKGYTADSLKFSLTTQGYSRVAVDQALEEANKILAAKAPVFKEKPMITYQVVDENDKPLDIKKPWWLQVKHWFGL